MNLDPEAAVVRHPHEVPRDVNRLRVGVVVPCPADDLLRSAKRGDGDGEGPEDPAPVHPVLVGGEGTVDGGADPGGTGVEGHLDAGNGVAAASVGITLDVEVAGQVAAKVDLGVVVGGSDGRVDVQLGGGVCKMVANGR